MIKVVLAMAKPQKATPPHPVNEIRYYNFTVIQTASDNASVLVTDELNKYNNSYHKFLISK
jgi:hypothetical protein